MFKSSGSSSPGTHRPKIGLYIHVPFCKAKCYYCDFNSFAGSDQLIEPYFKALEKEVALYRGILSGHTVSSVFIGGGTPSYVSQRYIYELMNVCAQNFNIESVAEVSMEANPGTLDHEKLIVYKAAGINRLSIGLQAWQNSLLHSIGRIHTSEQFVHNFMLAEKTGFENINADIIFGLPGQTINDWTETLSNVIKLGADHLSCYSLKIEEGTVFGHMTESGELKLLEDEEDREMYYLAIDMLKKKGFNHYEISNFSKPGYECRHNLIYWKAEQYIGIGAGAHSYFGGKRFNNLCSIESYIGSIANGINPVENIEVIDRKEEMLEYIMLGLRLVAGVNPDEFRSRFGCSLYQMFDTQLDTLMKKQLLEVHKGHIRLTPKGLDLANQVFMEFI